MKMHQAALLFADVPEFSGDKIRQLISQSLPSADVSQLSENGAGLVTIGGQQYALLPMSVSYPQSDLEAHLPFNYSLKNGQQIISEQKAHIIVSPFSEAEHLGQAIFQAAAITHLMAILSGLGKANAAFWANSGILQSAEQFSQTIKMVGAAIAAQQQGKAAGAELPVHFWAPIRVYSPDGGKSSFGAYTQGLSSFFGFELDLLASNQFTMAQAADTLMAVTRYLFLSDAPMIVGEVMDLAGKELTIKAHEHDGWLAVEMV